MPAIPSNLENLSVKQLSKLQNDLSAAITRKLDEAEKAKPRLQAELSAKLAKMVADLGLPPAQAEVSLEFRGKNGHVKSTKRARKAKIAIKYRNPGNPAETWSGRGRPARWLAALERQGRKRDEFRVGG